MAKIPEGILGPIFGKAGPVSGHRWNGQNIIRTSSRRGNTKPTPNRVAQQYKIKLCNSFTKAFTGTNFFNKSFPSYGDTGTGYNRATSALMSQAIVGNYPATFLSYPKILISQGPLPAAENAAATLLADESVVFTWADNSTTGIAHPKDTVILVAYFPQGGDIIYSLNAGVREDGQALLINKEPKGYAAETWMGFISLDERAASNSVYTGAL